MEGLGKKLQEARLARGLTLDEAGRMTKIRPAQLQEIENEDFSQFPSLTYAKGFLLIYGKFLDVDVSPYLEAFETSETLTTDGYSYLQSAGTGADPASESATAKCAREQRGRSQFVHAAHHRHHRSRRRIHGDEMVAQMQRLKPRPTPPPGSSPIATATASDKIIAPHAEPVETATVPPAPTEAPTATETAAPTVTPKVLVAPPAEPEVRRAEPVNPKDAAQIPTPSPSPKRSPRPPRPTPSPRASPTATARPR